MIERDIHLDANGNRLAGTLCLPEASGRFPTVLMAHGSGPLDRNQNMKGQTLEIFNAVAHHLAARGIASVRFDKRGCGSSQGDYLTAGHHDFVDDVTSWVDSLRGAEFCRPEQRFLLGHSEGCLVAAEVSLRRPEIAGLVLVCPFVEPMADILMRQARQIEREVTATTGITRLVNALVTPLVGSPTVNQQRLIRKVRASTAASIRVWFERVPAKWLRELLDVDAAQVFRNVTPPMLLIGGGKDLQCDPADVERIAELAQGHVTPRVIENMTHVLRRDDRPPTLFGQQRLLAQPVDAELLDLVSAWVCDRSEPPAPKRITAAS